MDFKHTITTNMSFYLIISLKFQDLQVFCKSYFYKIPEYKVCDGYTKDEKVILYKHLLLM